MADMMRGNSVREVSPSFDLFHRGNAKRYHGGGSSVDHRAIDPPSLCSTVYHVQPQDITRCTFSLPYRYTHI
jgi:hypothetical protein